MTGCYAASEKTSEPDTKSAPPATPPPIAPNRAAPHPRLSDSLPAPRYAPLTAPAALPPTAGIPPAHPASKSEFRVAKRTNTPPECIQLLRRERQIPSRLQTPTKPAPRA